MEKDLQPRDLSPSCLHESENVCCIAGKQRGHFFQSKESIYVRSSFHHFLAGGDFSRLPINF